MKKRTKRMMMIDWENRMGGLGVGDNLLEGRLKVVSVGFEMMMTLVAY